MHYSRELKIAKGLISEEPGGLFPSQFIFNYDLKHIINFYLILKEDHLKNFIGFGKYILTIFLAKQTFLLVSWIWPLI